MNTDSLKSQLPKKNKHLTQLLHSCTQQLTKHDQLQRNNFQHLQIYNSKTMTLTNYNYQRGIHI